MVTSSFRVWSITTRAAINDRAVAMVRDIASGEGTNGYFHKNGSFTVPEENFAVGVGDRPEDRTSKLYNLHRHHPFNDVAIASAITSVVAGVLGPAVDCFNSQFIFKNPGAWGHDLRRTCHRCSPLSRAHPIR